jgi:chorismate mutase
MKKKPLPLEEITRHRAQIDAEDHRLLAALARRMESACEIGRLKKRAKLETFQPGRWEQVLRDRLQTARKLGLDEEFTRSLFYLLHDESMRLQMRIRKRPRR